MKKISSILALIMTVSMFGQSVSASRYLDAYKKADLTYTDSFNENDMSEWKTFIDANKTWHLVEDGAGYSLTCTDDQSWLFGAIYADLPEKYVTNCSISADFIFGAGQRNNRAGIIFRAQDDQNLYSVGFGIQDGAGIATVSKRQNTTQWYANTIYSGTPSIPYNTSMNLRVDVIENTFWVYINGEEIFTYTDESSPLMTGKVGLLNLYGNPIIKNVKIKNIPVEKKEEQEKKSGRYVEYTSDEIKDFSDAVYDFYGWDDEKRGIISGVDDGIVIKADKATEHYRTRTVSYARKKFENEPIEFQTKGSPEGCLISFKNPGSCCPSNNKYDGYALAVRGDKLVLEKWVLGKQTVLGETSGEFISQDVYKSYKIVQVPEVDENKLKIVVYADDKEVISITDTENVMTDNGYINIVSYSDELYIKAPENKQKSMKQFLGKTNVAFAGSGKMLLNGNITELGAKVYKNNGVIMLPLRAIASQLGATVSWNDVTKTVDIKYNGNEIQIVSNSQNYFVNGNKKSIDGKCVIENGISYIPHSFFSEEFSMDFNEAENGLIFISERGTDLSGIVDNTELMENVILQIK